MPQRTTREKFIVTLMLFFSFLFLTLQNAQAARWRDSSPTHNQKNKHGQTGVNVHDVTYAELMTAVARNGLIVGDKYRLTDFRTRYTIPNTNDIHTGTPEILILTATTQNTFDLEVTSEQYPTDIIYYTHNNTTLYINDVVEGKIPDPAVDRGYILYRYDPIKNVEVGEDFRNMVFRRWETEVGNGIFAHFAPHMAPTDAAYKDFPLFADYSMTSEVHIDHHRDNNGYTSGANYLSNIVFRDYVYKVEILDGAENGTFLGKVIELSMKFCSKGTFYGDIERATFGTSSEVTATGSLYSVFINKAEIILDGNFSNVEILASYPSTKITGDYSNTVFGAETDNVYYLTPTSASVPGGNKDTPYILGSNNEDILVVDSSGLSGSAFILVDASTPLKTISITAKDDTYIAFASGVSFYGNTWELSSFNNLNGWKIEKEETLTLSALTGTWSATSHGGDDFSHTDWEGGYDSSNGYEVRYSLNAEQYSIVDKTTFNSTINTIDFDAGIKATVEDIYVEENAYGGLITNSAKNTTADGINKYGLYLSSNGEFSGGSGTATNNYGLFVETPTGADNNYAAVFAGGAVGIGTETPDFALDVAGDVRIEQDNKLAFGGTEANDQDANLFSGEANLLQSDGQFYAADGIATVVNAGPCSDLTFNRDTDGLTCIDTTNGRLYFRANGSWQYTAQTDGFEIPDEQAYSFNFEENAFNRMSPIASGDFLMPFANSFKTDGAVHGLYAKWSEVKSSLLQDETAQLSNLSMQTDSNLATIGDLQNATDEQIAILAGLISQQQQALNSNTTQTNDNTERIGSTNQRLDSAQNSVGLLESEFGNIAGELAEVLSKANLNKATLDDLLSLLTVNPQTNAIDIQTPGGLSAASLETGVVRIWGMEEEGKTIGQGVICPENLEIDAQGQCTIWQEDSNLDGFDDFSGNPISDGRSVDIDTSAVNETSRIFITARALIESPLVVTTVDELEQFFRVEIINPVTEPIPFDWWIVEER